ncbi:MAG TPA: TonB family protein [Thermoanaerobaculia bacterium]|nr:TonB family protein [Thermoanaerobaculia bacterium]
MSENILVVEYEPRYTDRVKQALVGQPFTPTFARDGEEAIRALDADSQPKLIVLSSVVPKISTTELIRAIRGRKPLQETPILLTVSGYNGKSPKADAQRVGASDILPKPYSETEFLGKIQQILGIRTPSAGQVTSNELFGDLLDDDKPKRTSPGTASSRNAAELDKMLADTLGGMMPKKRDTSSAPTQTGSQPVPKRSSGDIDKMLSDTLSGLEKSARKTTASGTAAAPKPAEPPVQTPPGGAPKFNTERMQAYVPDRVPVSQPVFPSAPPEPPKIERADHASEGDETVIEGVKFGQYVLVEKIATGGMAEVWKAYARGVEGFQKVVAIKKILPHLSDNQDFIEMFIDEAKLAAQLNHNNIIHIYDLGKIQSSYYIAMEYIDGFDLKTILRRGGERDHPMTVELALFIASKIAAALDYAHRKKDFEEKEMGLVHRDVSPQNVLISQEGDIKLCDFGIAKAASKASHTQAGALKGKLQYMAPEQAWGRNIDRRSDIFALATVLFEMLTSRKLFSGDNELSILEQVREARVQPPSLYNDEVTPEIDKIVIKALQKDPANRYQTAGEMARDIDAILYSFRPTPTSADLAIYMHRLSSAEADLPPVHEPEPEPLHDIPKAVPAPAVFAPPPVAPAMAPIAAAAAPAISAVPMAAAAAPVATAIPAHEPASYGDIPAPVKRKSAGPMIGVIIALLVVAGGAAFVLTRPKAAAPASTTTSTATPATASTATAAPAAAAAIPGTTTALPTSTAAAATSTGIDQSLVDAEVQKRLAAERARIDAQLRAQQAAAQPQTQTTAPARPAPAPVQTASAPPPAAVQQPETRPEPTPARTEPPAQVAETRPEPARAQPQVERAREGALIPAGTAGLTPPRIVRRGSVTYPAMARNQRIQGTVITSVLVSETGAVLDVRIIRGIGRPVGLDEAAEQAMRRSTFAPGTKDGVRVRSWLTVPVEFKL